MKRHPRRCASETAHTWDEKTADETCLEKSKAIALALRLFYHRARRPSVRFVATIVRSRARRDDDDDDDDDDAIRLVACGRRIGETCNLFRGDPSSDAPIEDARTTDRGVDDDDDVWTNFVSIASSSGR